MKKILQVLGCMFLLARAASYGECGCNDVGSYNSSCDQVTGQCFCQPGVTGRICDMCQPYFENLTSVGCQDCGECVDRLVALLDQVRSHLASLRSLVYELIALDEADKEGLSNISTTMNSIMANIDYARQQLDNYELQYKEALASTSNLESAITSLDSTFSALEYKIDALQLQSETRLDEIIVERTSMDRAITEVVNLGIYLQRSRTNISILWSEATEIHDNITAFQSNIFYSDEVTDARNYLRQINILHASAADTDALATIQTEQTTNLTNDLQELKDNVDYTEELLQDVVSTLNILESISSNVTASSSAIDANISYVDSAIQSAIANRINASVLTQNAASFVTQIQEDLVTLSESLGFPSNRTAPAPLVHAIDSLNTSVLALQSILMEVHSHVTSAENHRDNYFSVAETVGMILNPSIAIGRDALTAVTDYEQVVTNVNLAMNLSQTANLTATLALQQAQDLVAAGYITQVQMAYNSSLHLQQTVQNLTLMVNAVLDRIPGVESSVSMTTNLLSELRRTEVYLSNIAVRLEAEIAVALLNINVDIEAISANTSSVVQSHQRVMRQSSDVMERLQHTHTLLQNLSDIVQTANDTLQDTAMLLPEIEDAINQRTSLLNQVTMESSETTMLQQEMEIGLSDLRSRLAAIEEAAARISVAVRLNGSSSLSYRTPAGVNQNGFTSLSFFFRPEEISGTVISTETQDSQQLISLSLRNSSIVFSTVDSGTTSSAFLDLPLQNTWYHVLASEVHSNTASGLQLSVAEFGSGTHWSTSGRPSRASFNFTASESLLLGGTPDNRASEYYTGCVDGVELNGVQLPLLLPTSPQAAIPCGPRPPIEAVRDFENGTWFHGNGFVELETGSITDELSLQLSIRTFSENSILFYGSGTNNPSHYVVVYLNGGRVTLVTALMGIDSFVLSTERTYNDGQWHAISIQVFNQTGVISVDDSELKTTTSSFVVTTVTLNLSPISYFGGFTMDNAVHSPVAVTSGYAGCMNMVYLNGKPLHLAFNLQNSNVEFNGCPSQVVNGVRFMGTGLVELAPPSAPVYRVMFLFKTTQLAAVLLEVHPLQVAIYHTNVRATFDGVVLETATRSYSDGAWHSVSLIINQTDFQLSVDGTAYRNGIVSNVSYRTTADSAVFIGGAGRSGTLISTSLRGCIRNVVINEDTVDFNEAVRFEGVALYGCLPATAIPPTPSSSSTFTTPAITRSSSIEDTPSVFPTPTSSRLTSDSDFVSSEQTLSTSPLLTSSIPEVTPSFSISSVLTSRVDLTSSSVAVPTSVTDTLSSSLSSSTVTPSFSISSVLTSRVDLTSSSVAVPTSVADTLSSSLSSSTVTDAPSSTLLLSPSLTSGIRSSSTEIQPSSSPFVPLPPPPPPLPPPSQSIVSFSSSATSPSPTSEPPSPTSEPPSPTSEPPSPTSEPPSPTSEPPSPTSEPPSPTSEPPLPTSEPPSPTSEPPSPTLEPPSPTLEPPSPTLEPPSPTSEPPSPTSEPPSPTSEPPSPTSEPPSPTSEPPSTTSEPPSPTLEPPSPTLEPPSPTSEPPSPTSEPPSPTLEPPSPTSEPPSPTSEPPSPTSEPPSPTSEPPSPTSEPPSPTSEPPSTTSEPPSPTLEPPSPSSEPPSPSSEPPSPTSEPPSTTSEPPSPTSEPPSPTSELPSPTSEPPSPTSEPPSTTSEPPSPTFGVVSSASVSPSLVLDISQVVSLSSSVPSSVIRSPTPSPTPTTTDAALTGEFGSYFAFDVPNSMLRNQFNISLQFTAYASEGVLLFIGNNSVSDFLALELRGGYLFYSFDLGTGSLLLQSQKMYNDGLQHSAVLSRYYDGANGSLIVDGVVEGMGRSGGDYRALDLHNDLLYIGGVSSNIVARGILESGERYHPSMIGCFHSLFINDYPVDLSQPDGSQGNTSCPPDSKNIGTFSGSGYAQLLDAYDPGANFTISLGFRTNSSNGVLFYLINPDRQDFISLMVQNESVIFTFDNGGGSVDVISRTVNQARCCHGEWVNVTVKKVGTIGELILNSETVAMETSELEGFISVDALHPFYVGGIPDLVRKSEAITTSDFEGCIRDVTVTNHGLNISPTFIQSLSYGAITIGSCG